MKEFELQELPNHARVWFYNTDRAFTEGEEGLINEHLTALCSTWAAHGAKLTAGFEIYNHYLIVLAVDETKAAVSGCSIDSSVKVIREIGLALQVDLFNRHQVMFEKDGIWQIKPIAEFWAMRKAELISPETKLVNTVCRTLGEWRLSGVQTFVESWHQQMWER